MSFSFNHYYSIRQNTIKMLYERSEQPKSRFYFQDGSLQIYEMIPKEALRQIYESDGNTSRLNYEYTNNAQRVLFAFVDDLKEIHKNAINLREDYTLHEKDTLIIFTLNDSRPEKKDMEIQIQNVELFWFKELCFCVTEHVLVPKHILVDDVEKNQLMTSLYMNNLLKLPTVLKNDPVAKWFGAKEGDLFKIIRESPNVGIHNFYRVVVGTDIPAKMQKIKSKSSKSNLEVVLNGVNIKAQNGPINKYWKRDFETLVANFGYYVFIKHIGKIHVEKEGDIPQIAYDNERYNNYAVETFKKLDKITKFNSSSIDDNTGRVVFNIDASEIIGYGVKNTHKDSFYQAFITDHRTSLSVEQLRKTISDNYNLPIDHEINEQVYSAICDLLYLNVVVFDIDNKTILNQKCLKAMTNIYFYKIGSVFTLLTLVTV